MNVVSPSQRRLFLSIPVPNCLNLPTIMTHIFRRFDQRQA